MKLLQVSVYFFMHWKKFICGDFQRSQVKKATLEKSWPTLAEVRKKARPKRVLLVPKEVACANDIIYCVLDWEKSLNEKADFSLICSCLAN